MTGFRALAIGGAIATLALLLWSARTPTPAPQAEPETAASPLPGRAEPLPAPAPAPQVETGLPQSAVPDASENPASAAAEPGTSLSGWVGTESGSGLEGIQIEIQSLGFDGEEKVTTTVTSKASGGFQLENIVPDRQYRLEIKPQRSYAGHSLDSFTTDSAEALEEITLVRIELVDAEGMIVDTDLAPVADFELSVRSLAAQFPDRVIRSDSSGYFKLTAFPAGELRIATNASDYYRIKGIKLRPDEYRNLTLIIDRGSYHLSGWVSDDNGAPLAQAQVTLKSAFATDEYHSFSYRSAVTDDNGGFEFAQLGGHRLTLGIYASGFKSSIVQHDFKSFADSVEIKLQPDR
jgi:hypothetical protein